MKGSDDCLDLLYSLALSVSQFLDVLFLCRNELMKWRIKETNCYRISFKCLIEFLEVSLLLRQIRKLRKIQNSETKAKKENVLI